MVESACNEESSKPPQPEVPSIPIPRGIVRRLIASEIDLLLQFVIGVAVIKSLPKSWEVLQLPLIIFIFVGYFFLFEGLFARTPGKLATGLIVVQFDGRKCTWYQALIRAAWRAFEVNPLLLGGVPAAISIVRATYHQRIGDRWARTLVVPTNVLREIRRVDAAETSLID